jgi:hypothetical protein
VNSTCLKSVSRRDWNDQDGILIASVAQLDRASVFGTEGWRFESSRVHLTNVNRPVDRCLLSFSLFARSSVLAAVDRIVDGSCSSVIERIRLRVCRQFSDTVANSDFDTREWPQFKPLEIQRRSPLSMNLRWTRHRALASTRFVANFSPSEFVLL